MHSCVEQQYWVKHGLSEQIPISSLKALRHLVCSFTHCFQEKKERKGGLEILSAESQC